MTEFGWCFFNIVEPYDGQVLDLVIGDEGFMYSAVEYRNGYNMFSKVCVTTPSTIEHQFYGYDDDKHWMSIRFKGTSVMSVNVPGHEQTLWRPTERDNALTEEQQNEILYKNHVEALKYLSI